MNVVKSASNIPIMPLKIMTPEIADEIQKMKLQEAYEGELLKMAGQKKA